MKTAKEYAQEVVNAMSIDQIKDIKIAGSAELVEAGILEWERWDPAVLGGISLTDLSKEIYRLCWCRFPEEIPGA